MGAAQGKAGHGVEERYVEQAPRVTGRHVMRGVEDTVCRAGFLNGPTTFRVVPLDVATMALLSHVIRERSFGQARLLLKRGVWGHRLDTCQDILGP